MMLLWIKIYRIKPELESQFMRRHRLTVWMVLGTALIALGGCGSSGEGAEATQPDVLIVAERTPAEKCSARLSDVMAQFLNEENAGSSSLALSDVIGQLSPVYYDLTQFGGDVLQERSLNGFDASDSLLHDGLTNLCERSDIQTEILSASPGAAGIPFDENSDAWQCVERIEMLSLDLTLPVTAQGLDPLFDATMSYVRDSIGRGSMLAAQLAQVFAESLSERVRHGIGSQTAFLRERANMLCADATLVEEALRLP